MKKVLAVLAVGLLAAADGPVSDDARADLKKLAGTWALVAEVSGGQKRDDDYLKKIKWVINEDGTWKVLEDGKVKYRGKLTVDPTKKPRAIDSISILAGQQEGTVVRSIYEVNGDTLKHCFTVNGDRPETFESKPGSRCTNSVFKRVKEK
jgi:uncharacterized protein (TIGR03067 family)